MMTALWILLWIVGSVIVYTCATLLYGCDGWRYGQRGNAIAAAFLSWVFIGIVIFLAIIAGIIYGGEWLYKKGIGPYLEKYEKWVCKKLGSKKEKVTV